MALWHLWAGGRPLSPVSKPIPCLSPWLRGVCAAQPDPGSGLGGDVDSRAGTGVGRGQARASLA